MTSNEQLETDPQLMVKRFHRLFDIVVQQTPGLVDERTRVLRERLIQEEFDELKEAMAKEDLPAVAKELADLLVGVTGDFVPPAAVLRLGFLARLFIQPIPRTSDIHAHHA